MAKRVIQLTESELNRMISKTIKSALREHMDSINDYKDLPQRSKYFDPYDDNDENEDDDWPMEWC